MSGKTPEAPAGTPSRTTYVAAAALAALVGFAAVYVTRSPADNAATGPGAAPATATATSEAAGKPESGAEEAGKLAAFVTHKAPTAMPGIAFVDGNGQPKTLEDFRGKTVLLNLWATWCAPCRKEMPSLDRLQKALGSDKFEVVALAVDRNGLEAAKKFLADIKVENLAAYADPTAKLGTQLKAVGLPTTILIDKEGREVGRLPGPAEWDGEDAKALIAAVLK